MIWLLAMVIACLACVFKQGMERAYGFSWWMVAMLAGILIVVEGGFWTSMRLAPSFFQAWFVSIALLAFFGWLASILVFKEPVYILHIIGAVVILVGSYFLIK